MVIRFDVQDAVVPIQNELDAFQAVAVILLVRLGGDGQTVVKFKGPQKLILDVDGEQVPLGLDLQADPPVVRVLQSGDRL